MIEEETMELRSKEYSNGKVLFLYNSCFYGRDFTLLRAKFREAFEKYDVGLGFKTNDNLGYYHDDDFSSLDYDFILFYDKDISLASRLERQGFKVFNKSEAIRVADSKIETGIMLNEWDIPTIPFVLSPYQFEGSELDILNLLALASKRFHYPYVIKEEFGSLGQQVYKADNDSGFIDILMNIHPPKRVLIQPYLENNNSDHRLYVVGDEVIGAIKRTGENDFRSNIGRGGKGAPYTPTEKEEALAIKASKALGLDFSGVDLLQDENGEPLICEVNSAPRFLGLYETTGIDMAKEIAKYLLRKVY